MPVNSIRTGRGRNVYYPGVGTLYFLLVTCLFVSEGGSSSEVVADRLESSPPLSDSVCLYVYNLPPETDKAFLLSVSSAPS